MAELDFRSLKSIRQIAQENPAFSEGGLRWLVFNARSNGLAPHLVRVGRRLLINEPGFNHWLGSKGQK